jgi:hypothetical protein
MGAVGSTQMARSAAAAGRTRPVPMSRSARLGEYASTGHLPACTVRSEPAALSDGGPDRQWPGRYPDHVAAYQRAEANGQ